MTGSEYLLRSRHAVLFFVSVAVRLSLHAHLRTPVQQPHKTLQQPLLVKLLGPLPYSYYLYSLPTVAAAAPHHCQTDKTTFVTHDKVCVPTPSNRYLFSSKQLATVATCYGKGAHGHGHMHAHTCARADTDTRTHTQEAASKCSATSY